MRGLATAAAFSVSVPRLCGSRAHVGDAAAGERKRVHQAPSRSLNLALPRADDRGMSAMPWERVISATLAAIWVSSIALAGCRTTEIGGPIEIPIPHNIS